MTQSEATNAGESQALVPSTWPAVRSDVPRAVWYAPGLLALPGMAVLWLLPKTAGVRLAAAGWIAAIAAHLLGMALGAGLITWAEAFPQTNPIATRLIPLGPAGATIVTLDLPTRTMTPTEYLLAPFTALVILLHDAGPTGWATANAFGVFLLIEAGFVLLALILMPYAAAGEPARRLFGRCLRLTLWSTTMLIPLGIGFMLDPLFRKWLDLPNIWLRIDYARLALFGLWWLWVWIRAGYQYAGPPEGPGWQPRTPTCEGCGYIIAHIPVSTRCPECGRPVEQSMPQRRHPPSFAGPDGRTRSFRTFLFTCWKAIVDKSFFDHLAVLRDPQRDRSFFFTLCGINAVLALLGSLLPLIFDQRACGANVWDRVVLASEYFGAEVFVCGLFAILVAAVDRRTIQSAAIASYYACTLFLPFTLVWVISFSVTNCIPAWPNNATNNVILSAFAAIIILGCTWLVYACARCLRSAFLKTRRAQG